jgi:hypothetical protein
VAANQARAERKEVPLAAGRFQDLDRVNTDAIENDRQLVHQGDIQIPLRVLDDLGGLGHLDARSRINAGRDHAAIHLPDPLQRCRCVPGNDLDDFRQRPFLVARIDPLR